MKINYLDLFSGIGGFALGLQQAGFKIKKHYFSEVDKYAIEIYKKHFPQAIPLGDIRGIRDFKAIGKIDIVTFGFPCQDLSINGKRQGFDGERSSLFFEAVRVIRKIKPRVFIFENVKNLLSGQRGEWFKRCLQEIANIGLYECQWQLLNTRWFLPQSRERVYFVGSLGTKCFGKIFPLGEGEKKDIKLSRYSTNTLTSRNGENNTVGTYVVEGQFFSQEDKKIRRLTPLEFERLQGFPDGWTDGVSDTQRYKAIGNAVSVPVAKVVLEKIKKAVKC